MDWAFNFAKEHSVFFVVIATLLVSLIFAGGIALDLSMNPWLYEVVEKWQWYNYLTSGHGPAALYINGHYQVLPVFIIPAFLVSLLFVKMAKWCS